MTLRSSKTPYEIRLELLQLAFDVLVRQHQAAAAAGDNKANPVSAPTTEEVIAEADKMNIFISEASQQHRH